MKSCEEQALRTWLDHNVAQRGNGKTMVGLEVVQDAAFAAVGEDLIVDVQIDLFGQLFDLETHLVNDIVAADEPS